MTPPTENVITSEKVASFFFLVEGLENDGAARRGAGALTELPCGPGVVEFALGDASPRLEPVQPDAAVAPEALRFEPIQIAGRDALVMAVPPGLDVRVNGRPTPRLAILDVADQVQLRDAVLHVTRFRKPYVGPPTPEHRGRRCPVCSVSFDADTRVFVCECNAVLHAEEPGTKPDRDLLQCSSLGTCPDCARPVSMTTGFVYTPE